MYEDPNSAQRNVEQYLNVISITPVVSEYAASDLHMDYVLWCRQNKMKYLCTRDFAASLQSLGWTRRHTRRGNYWAPPGEAFTGEAFTDTGEAFTGEAFTGTCEAFTGEAFTDTGEAFTGEAFTGEGFTDTGEAFTGEAFTDTGEAFTPVAQPSSSIKMEFADDDSW